MRISFLKVTTAVLCAAGIASPVMAESGFSSSATNAAPPSSVSGYSSSSDAPPSTTTGGYNSSVEQQTGSQQSGYSSSTSAPPSTTAKHKKHNRFSVSLNIPGTDTVISYREPKHHGKHHRQDQPFWIPLASGEPVPANAVIGGGQHHPNATFYVCRANYRGGVHPGKYFDGNCNISWGGRELVMPHFEILVSDTPLAWSSGSYGSIPRHALSGGSERNHTLYVCQADYENGTHTGKIIGKSCNFGWGGREISVPYYSVLVG